MRVVGVFGCGLAWIVSGCASRAPTTLTLADNPGAPPPTVRGTLQPSMPTITLVQGLGASPRSRRYHMTIHPDGRVRVQDDACPTVGPGESQLTAAEMSYLRDKLRVAKLRGFEPTYLPRGEGDDVGAPRETLTVAADGEAVTIEFDVRHAPPALVSLWLPLSSITDRVPVACAR